MEVELKLLSWIYDNFPITHYLIPRARELLQAFSVASVSVGAGEQRKTEGLDFRLHFFVRQFLASEACYAGYLFKVVSIQVDFVAKVNSRKQIQLNCFRLRNKFCGFSFKSKKRETGLRFWKNSDQQLSIKTTSNWNVFYFFIFLKISFPC